MCSPGAQASGAGALRPRCTATQHDCGVTIRCRIVWGAVWETCAAPLSTQLPQRDGVAARSGRDGRGKRGHADVSYEAIGLAIDVGPVRRAPQHALARVAAARAAARVKRAGVALHGALAYAIQTAAGRGQCQRAMSRLRALGNERERGGGRQSVHAVDDAQTPYAVRSAGASD